MTQEVFRAWEQELRHEPIRFRQTQLQSRLMKYLDEGHGPCDLADPAIADLVLKSLWQFHRERYDLLAWVVMPNHVHVLVNPYPGVHLDRMVQNWKSFTAHELNRRRGHKGRFWSRDYFDRFMRDEDHRRQVIEYIEDNPVKARLVSRPEEWRWSSAARPAGGDASGPS